MIVVGWPITVHGSTFNLPVEKLYLYFDRFRVGRSFGRTIWWCMCICWKEMEGSFQDNNSTWRWIMACAGVKMAKGTLCWVGTEVEWSTNLIEFDLYQCSRLEKFVNAYGMFLKAKMKVNMKLHANGDCKVYFEEAANFALHKVKGWIPSRKTYLIPEAEGGAQRTSPKLLLRYCQI
ncbi:hypothetical protein LINGRAHAP2_LOCUS8993 [Linum grandiflorum]